MGSYKISFFEIVYLVTLQPALPELFFIIFPTASTGGD